MNDVRPAPSAYDAPSAYELSRAYAQGWSVAKKLGTANKTPMEAAACSNPYISEEERSRWMTGFADAVASPPRASASATQNSWRPNRAAHLARRVGLPR
jgi:hypothetical protein